MVVVATDLRLWRTLSGRDRLLCLSRWRHQMDWVAVSAVAGRVVDSSLSLTERTAGAVGFWAGDGLLAGVCAAEVFARG